MIPGLVGTLRGDKEAVLARVADTVALSIADAWPCREIPSHHGRIARLTRVA
jgi:hypothetical protein